MINVNEAWDLIRDAMPACGTRPVGVAEAVGAVLAQDVRADRDQPPFDRVMMDGIAIRFTADPGPRVYKRIGIQAAGALPLRLTRPGQCIEVMTGAVLPDGADTVIPVERIDIASDQVSIETGYLPSPGQFIHVHGSDYRRDHKLLEKGTLIRGPEMAVLVSSGLASVAIASSPDIAIIAVGDELVDPGVPTGPAQIRRSNDFAIAALLSSDGLSTRHRQKLGDDPVALGGALNGILDNHDVVVLTGGVSMGKFDYIPQTMANLGVNILLHKVAQKPGKPMWVGRRGRTVVFALPGNPVSALVCARRYVLPAIQHAMGRRMTPESVSLAEIPPLHTTLTQFPAVTLDQSGRAHLQVTNTSGDFHTLAGTTGFIELPAGTTRRSGIILWRW